MSSTPTNSSTQPLKVIQYTLYCILGLTPLLFVAGLDSPALLPRLFLCQLGTLLISILYLRNNTSLNTSPFHLPIFIYLAFMVLSAFWAINPFRSVHFLAKHVTFIGFFVVLSGTLKKEQIPNLLLTTTLTGAAVSFYGILEYHNIIPPWIPSTGRPSSTFMFRNLAAHYLVVNLPLAGLLFLIAQNSLQRWISSIGAVCMFVFLLYTRTRGAWVGLFSSTILCLSVWLWANRKSLLQAIRERFDRQARIFAGISLLFVAILGPLPAGFQEQHAQRFDEKKADITSAVTSIFTKGGDRGRTQMWYHTLDMIKDTPWGVGLGNWEFKYPVYDQGEQISPDVTPRRPHNDLLWIASEIGLLGVGAYLSILIIVLIVATKIWKHTTSTQDRFIVLMCSISIFAMIGDGLFNFPYERIAPSLLFWLSLSLITLCYKHAFPTPKIASYKSGNYLLPLLLLGATLITIKNIAFDYHYIRAVSASLENNAPQASQEAKLALSHGPFNHQAFVIYGRALKDLNQFEQGEQALIKAQKYHPYFSNIYNNLGHIYDNWGRFEDAITAYKKAITLMPTHHKAIYNIGIIYEKQGQLEKAKTAYEKAIATDGDFGKAYHNLAGVFNKQNQPDSAQVYYLKAISAVNATPESYFNLGNLYAEHHRFESAIKAYETFMQNWHDDTQWLVEAKKGLSEAYSGWGVQKEQQGDIDQALKSYETAIGYWPENAMNWYNLGNAYRLQSDLTSAISAYQKAIDRDNQFTNAYNNLGLTYTDLKQYDKAIEIFEKSKVIHSERPMTYLNLANAYLGKGDIHRAIEAYETFLTLWQGEANTAQQVKTVLKELKAAIK